MNGTDPGAGQHGDGSLRDHGHVDGDAIALVDTAGLEHVGKPADFLMQFTIGDMAAVVWLIPFKDDGGMVAPGFEMTVKAVGGGVERAILIPFNAQVFGIVGDVFNPGIGFDPVDALAVFGPEGIVIGNRLLIHGLIGRIIHMGMGGGFGAWRKNGFAGHDSLLLIQLL
ncbi:MAG: Uncharacterised protein [SAR116 cluster bacterium MED-G04]|nr:MAG: Uncharacterised protein [SAR116 cluster bacterium MED-G04]